VKSEKHVNVCWTSVAVGHAASREGRAMASGAYCQCRLR
jgi:hypothetical protein